MISGLIGRVCTRVTYGATISGLIVCKRHNQRHPRISGMTGITEFAGQWMVSRLVSTVADTIVTTSAVTGLPCHCAMIKHNLQPTGGVMTYITGLSGWNMINIFTNSNRIIMAVFTRVAGLIMVER